MLAVYVFSFNRGPFLRHCIESVREHAPDLPLTVVDDSSTDQETREVLASLPEMVRVLRPDSTGEGRHGGLYANMQLALEDCRENHLLFLQDDMQLVRALRPEDLDYFDAFFAHYPKAAFLNPVFLKGQRVRRDRRITRLAGEFPVYFRNYPQKSHPRGLSYSDAVVADVGRLRRAGWQFSSSEVENAWQAQQLFGAMGFMAHPFVMFLPQVPVYRGRRTTWAVAFAERLGGVDPKGFETLRGLELETFLQRDLAELPVAERYLRCTDPSVPLPFQYSAVNAFPLLRIAHKFEQWLRRK